ncbi:MAG: class I SAM-dependent methyltransferase [Myxococcales bacterium]|nr:class I SAM-dependent methyltransferase [Myxococcales bacterium]
MTGSLKTLGTGWDARVARVFAAAELEVPDRSGFVDLLDQVVIWNRRHNLTAARDADELVDLYLADAAWLAKLGARLITDEDSPSRNAWVDVGSGGGAPGLPLALLLPRLHLTLVEPRDKRVAFLRSMLGRLNLTRAQVLRQRSDTLPDRSAAVALARATLPPPEWLREGARLARRAVWVLLAKEPAPTLEGWRLEQLTPYAWPLTGFERSLALYVPDAED